MQHVTVARHGRFVVPTVSAAWGRSDAGVFAIGVGAMSVACAVGPATVGAFAAGVRTATVGTLARDVAAPGAPDNGVSRTFAGVETLDAGVRTPATDVPAPGMPTGVLNNPVPGVVAAPGPNAAGSVPAGRGAFAIAVSVRGGIGASAGAGPNGCVVAVAVCCGAGSSTATTGAVGALSFCPSNAVTV